MLLSKHDRDRIPASLTFWIAVTLSVLSVLSAVAVGAAGELDQIRSQIAVGECEACLL